MLARVREAGERAADYGYPPDEVAEWEALVPQLREEARLLRRLRDNSGLGENPADRPAPDGAELAGVGWTWERVYAFLRERRVSPEPGITELRIRVLELLRLELDQRNEWSG